jgi:hypothetical protein
MGLIAWISRLHGILGGAAGPLDGCGGWRAVGIWAATEVGLALRVDSVTAPREGSVVQRLHVRNGDVSFDGPVMVTYVSPMYVNIDHDVPDGCTIRLRDPDPTVSEVVTCHVTGHFDAGAEFTMDMPLTVTSRARFVGRTPRQAIRSTCTSPTTRPP